MTHLLEYWKQKQKENKWDLNKIGSFCTTKEARIYNELKTISLTSGAGKTGQPLVKE